MVLDLILAFGCCFNGFIFSGHPKKHCAFKCLQSSATELIIFQCCAWPCNVNCQGKTALVQNSNKEAKVGFVACVFISSDFKMS